MAENSRMTAATNAAVGSTITYDEVTGHTRITVALGVVALLAAMLLSGVPRGVAIAGILLCVALLVDFYRF